MRRDVEFTSQGDICRGWLFTPDDRPKPWPAVVMAGGWCYVKEIVMPHYADHIVKAGTAALVFDYRGFGASDGQPRQHLDPWKQIEDYRNALSFLETQPDIDPERLGVWGISYSGGHVLIVGANDSRVRCIVSTIPVVDGHQNMVRIHGESRFAELQRVMLQDRRRRYADGGGSAMLPMSSPHPEKELSGWPFPDVYEIFNRLKDTEAPRHEHRNTVESIELFLNYDVSPYVKRILGTPTLMIVAPNDEKTLWDLEIEQFNRIPSPRKKLSILPDISHMSLYANVSHLQIAGKEAAEWFALHLGKGRQLAAHGS